MIAVTGRPVPKTSAIVAAGVFLLLLPLCGGHGLTQVPALTAWIGIAGLCWLRSQDPDLRKKGRIMCAFALASALFVAYYFYDFHLPPSQEQTLEIARVWRTTAQFLTLSIGLAARRFWPFSAWAVLGLCAATIWLCLRVFRSQPSERLRTSAIVAGYAGIVSMALSAGIGRASDYEGVGFATRTRYITLPSPILCCTYFAWCRWGSPAVGRFVRVALYSTMALLFAYNMRQGEEYALWRMGTADRFARDIQAGLSIVREALGDVLSQPGRPRVPAQAARAGGLDALLVRPRSRQPDALERAQPEESLFHAADAAVHRSLGQGHLRAPHRRRVDRAGPAAG
jgi:hypothetical protein